MPEADICVYEGGRKPLAKVAVTGGGRCNLTNSFRSVNSIDDVYPRGARLMKRLLREFSHTDAMAWFEEAGVRLTVQEDDCVFPVAGCDGDSQHFAETDARVRGQDRDLTQGQLHNAWR